MHCRASVRIMVGLGLGSILWQGRASFRVVLCSVRGYQTHLLIVHTVRQVNISGLTIYPHVSDQSR